MKKNYHFAQQFIVVLTLFFTSIGQLCAQNITYSFANAEITNDGMNSFYEADIMISTDTDFKFGTAVLFIDYNVSAFGTDVASSGGTPQSVLTLPHPSGDASTGYVMDERFASVINAYGAPSQFNSTTSKFSITFNQAQNSGLIATNVTSTGSPVKLCHIKIQYSDVAEDPMIAFDAVNSDGTTFTVQTTTAPPSADGVQLTADTYDSSNSTPCIMWDGSADNDWNTASNWASGSVPTSSTNVIIPAGKTVIASGSIDVKDLDIEVGGALTVATNINKSGSLHRIPHYLT